MILREILSPILGWYLEQGGGRREGEWEMVEAFYSFLEEGEGEGEGEGEEREGRGRGRGAERGISDTLWEKNLPDLLHLKENLPFLTPANLRPLSLYLRSLALQLFASHP